MIQKARGLTPGTKILSAEIHGLSPRFSCGGSSPSFPCTCPTESMWVHTHRHVSELSKLTHQAVIELGISRCWTLSTVLPFCYNRVTAGILAKGRFFPGKQASWSSLVLDSGLSSASWQHDGCSGVVLTVLSAPLPLAFLCYRAKKVQTDISQMPLQLRVQM